MVGIGIGSLTPAAPSKLLTLQTLRLVDVPLSQTTRVHSRTTNLTALLLTFKDLLGQLDLDRSQKVDLSMCRSQGLIRSLTLEAKHLRCGKISCELHVIYRKVFHQL